jgi:hypothetical protein
VWIGPSQKDMRLSRSLWWNSTDAVYEIQDEGLVAPPSPPPASAPKPGEKAAVAAALENDAGYVGKVMSHSGDWKQVTVWTGPPHSEFVNVYRFHWDDGMKQYILDHAGLVGEPASPSPGD